MPVYALANAAHEFVLVSSTRVGGQRGEGVRPPPALGLLCFRKEDADALLEQMEGDMRAGSTVVPVALNKVGVLLLGLECPALFPFMLFDHLVLQLQLLLVSSD